MARADLQPASKKTDDREQRATTPPPPPPPKKGFTYRGEFQAENSAIEVIQKVLIIFADENPEFLEGFAARKHGRKRRWIARSKNDLYPDRPDFAEKSVELVQGWWMGTNYSIPRIEKMVELACEVANVEIGKDLVVSL